jgi:uncharacterized membrane protein YdbT with pleckstrin-like domain
MPDRAQLRAGEHVLYQGRPSWRALFAFYAGGLLLAAAVFVVVGLLVGEVVWGVVAAAVIAGLTLVVGYLRRLFVSYLITNQRLRISRGVLRKQVQETRLERVQNVNYSQSLMDRLFRVGTVDFDTAATDDSGFRFEWVNDPDQVVRAVHDATSELTASAAERLPRTPL